jgi:hypothetical protein
LEKEKPFSIIEAESVQTTYGISIILTIKVSSEEAIRVFLPKRFTPVFSDIDLDMKNGGMIKINIIYYFTSEKTSPYQLSLKEEQE